MGKYSDLAKQGVRYKLTEEEQVEQQPAEGDGDFKRGFKKAMLQVPQTLGGTAALIGDLTGSQGLKELGLGIYQNNADKIAAITKDSDSLSNVLEGDASAADWLANSAGYVGGQALQAIATGGVGGFIGSQLAKRGIANVVARGAESLAARTVAQKVASRGATIGAGSALLGSNVVQEAGSIYPEALHVAAEQGRELTGMDKARVVGSSLAAAGVDTAMDALMLGRVLKGARKPGESMLRAGVREVPGAMAREGVTEGIQTGIERYGAGQELNTADAIRDYVDSIGVGVVGGGMGGAASVLRSQKVPESGPLTRAANTAIEQQILQLEYDPQPLLSFPDGSVGTKAEAEMWLLQFPEGAEREGKRRELMGRDPETGKRIQPEAAPDPTHAQTPDEEAAYMADWTAQHDPVDLDQAHAILGTPGAKGKGLMIAPHPDGGFTLVQGNKLTIDTQARIADLQKPVKSEASKEGEAKPEPVTDVAPDAQPEWKTNPYTAFKFADAARAEAFMAKRSADPALFEVQPVGDKFAIKRRTTPTATEGVINADNAVLAQDGAADGRGGDQALDLPGGGETGGTGAVAGRDGEGRTADGAADATAEPGVLRPAGGADTDAALNGATFSDEVTGAHSGQTNHTLTMRGANGKPVGSIEYTIYQGKPSISMIDVPKRHRRKGYGAALVTQMQKQFPDIEIDWGGMTDDGAKLRASLDLQEMPSEHAADFARLDAARGERDALLAKAEEFQQIDSPTDQQRDEYYQAIAPLNDLHDEIDDLERNLYGERPTKTIIAGPRKKEKSADVPQPAQVPEEAPAAAGAESQAEPEAAPAKPASRLDQARAKHQRQDDAVAQAAANIAARKAQKEQATPAPAAPEAQAAPATEPVQQATPAEPERDDGADIPKAFYRKVMVPHEVHVEGENRTETVDVKASDALKSTREDIAHLRALLDCMGG